MIKIRPITTKERIEAIFRYTNEPVTAKKISMINPDKPMALVKIKFKR